MKKKPAIVLCGSIAIDRLMSFSGKYSELIDPEKVDILSFSVFLTKLKNSYGGVGANIGYTLALLGEKPILLGALGNDATGYLQRLSEVGIDTSHIHISNLSTASFNVITDSDNNQIGGFYPGAMFDSDTLTLEKWKDKSALVVVSPHDPKAMKRQIEECSRYNFRLCYDIGQQVVNTSSEDLAYGLSWVELLILNEFELSVFCQKVGETPGSLKSKIPIVITTLGEKGSVIEGKNVSEKIEIPAALPKEVLDPTGAGDAYRAGFLYGYARDWDLALCGKMGAVAATYALENHGTQEHSFTKEDFMRRFESSFGEKLLLS